MTAPPVSTVDPVRKCVKCGELKAESAFTARNDGYMSHRCIPCHRIANKEYRERAKDRRTPEELDALRARNREKSTRRYRRKKGGAQASRNET